ncbi:MAG: hypothetical protein K2X03_22100 [Bryobacteraceae bacterium]|nr:hypothetical protein [Bryobacteraceae bacterium]
MKRFIFWDYPRASFPYDIMVALILAFIFLTPPEIFRDRPRASEVAMLPGGMYMIGAEELAKEPESARPSRASELIRKRFHENVKVVKVEPHYDAEQEVKGFMAYTKP